MIGDFLSKLFGANWRTSLSGIVTLATAAISAKPEIINWLPQSWQPPIVGISNFVVFLSGTAFVLAAKDKKVVGGTVQQDAAGNVAEPQKSTPQPPKPAVPKP